MIWCANVFYHDKEKKEKKKYPARAKKGIAEQKEIYIVCSGEEDTFEKARAGTPARGTYLHCVYTGAWRGIRVGRRRYYRQYALSVEQRHPQGLDNPPDYSSRASLLATRIFNVLDGI